MVVTLLQYFQNNTFIINEKNRDFKWFCKDFCSIREKIMQKLMLARSCRL